MGPAFNLRQLVEGNLGGVTGLQPDSCDLAPAVGFAILGGAVVLLFVATTFAPSRRLDDDAGSPGGDD